MIRSQSVISQACMYHVPARHRVCSDCVFNWRYDPCMYVWSEVFLKENKILIHQRRVYVVSSVTQSLLKLKNVKYCLPSLDVLN